MDRASMLAGAEATQQCYSPSGTHSILLAADLDGYTLRPSGEAETVIGLGTTTTLNYWRFHVDWATPSNSTFTGPTALTVASYSRPAAATSPASRRAEPASSSTRWATG